MTPTVDLGALAKPRLWEYVVRFAFGGLVTAVAGIVARAFGPSVGGLFLAFPAIVPASLTLVARHESRRDAADGARGAILGAAGLAAFAAVALTLVSRGALVALGAATTIWTITAVSLWLFRDGMRNPTARSAR